MQQRLRQQSRHLDTGRAERSAPVPRTAAARSCTSDRPSARHLASSRPEARTPSLIITIGIPSARRTISDTTLECEHRRPSATSTHISATTPHISASPGCTRQQARKPHETLPEVIHQHFETPVSLRPAHARGRRTKNFLDVQAAQSSSAHPPFVPPVTARNRALERHCERRHGAQG